MEDLLSNLPPLPEFGQNLPATNPSDETIRLLLARRSTTAKTMVPPGPTAGQLATLIACGTRVPDHGKLAPWRFILFEGDDRAKFGDLLESIAATNDPTLSPERREEERTRFLRAPTIVAVISSPVDNGKIPIWEQLLSAGAVCQTMLVAANAMGLAGQWLTEWCAYDPAVQQALGLASHEQIAGYLYFATADGEVMERKRPDIAALVSRWQGQIAPC